MIFDRTRLFVFTAFCMFFFMDNIVAYSDVGTLHTSEFDLTAPHVEDNTPKLTPEPVPAHPAPAPVSLQKPEKPLTSLETGMRIMLDVHHGMIAGTGKRCDNEGDPIIAESNQCYKSAKDRISSDACAESMYDSYNKLMNRLYEQALANSDDVTKRSLKKSQEQWLAFREAEAAARNKHIAANGAGSGIGGIIEYEDIVSIRERISEFMFYLGGQEE